MVDEWKGMNRQYRVSNGTITLSKAFAEEHGDRMVADAMELIRPTTPGGTVVGVVKKNPYPALLAALPRVGVDRRGRPEVTELKGMIKYCFGIGRYDPSPLDYWFDRVAGGPIKRFQGPGFHIIYNEVLAAQQAGASPKPE